jgi:hypothetical protein
MTMTTPMGWTIDQWLDYLEENHLQIPSSLYDDADDIFEIDDDTGEYPQGYFLWVARNYYRLMNNML